MRTTRSVARLVGVGLVFLALAACTTQEGEEGNYYFKYEHEGILVFGMDVAVGTRVDVGVYADEEATQPVDLTSAAVESDEEGTAFDIVTVDGHVVTLEATRAGDVDLIATDGDVSDRVAMTADPVDTLEWHIPNPFDVSDEVGDFAAGGTALIPIDLKNGDDLLVGYGLTGVTADPTTGATIPDQAPFRDVWFVHVDFETAGAVNLLHPQATALAVNVVAPAAVTALAWNDFGASTVSTDGAATPLFLDAKQADERLVFGLLGVATVESTTPTTCSVASSPLWGDGVYEVSGVAVGSCTVRATLGALTAEWTGTVSAPD